MCFTSNVASEMTPDNEVYDGFWTWVGDYVIGTEADKQRFIAIHKTGKSHFHIYWNEDKRCAAQQAVERCQPHLAQLG